MIATSVLIPPAAVGHRLAGTVATMSFRRRVDAVLFDRDGTLVVDVPFNADPARVQPMPDAATAIGRLRAANLRTGVVSNQSGVARALMTTADVDAVNARIDTLVGPIETWHYCPHDDGHGCSCRKPAPGLVVAAARALGSSAERCVVIGDTGADVQAAEAAGARAVLVPNPATMREEIEAAGVVTDDLHAAVDYVMGLVRS
jgi:histidinol-phosphate phosphatase family protein